MAEQGLRVLAQRILCNVSFFRDLSPYTSVARLQDPPDSSPRGWQFRMNVTLSSAYHPVVTRSFVYAPRAPSLWSYLQGFEGVRHRVLDALPSPLSLSHARRHTVSAGEQLGHGTFMPRRATAPRGQVLMAFCSAKAACMYVRERGLMYLSLRVMVSVRVRASLTFPPLKK